MATHIASAAGTASLTAYGKQVVARSMYEKGKAFLAAAILLRQRHGYEYAVLHLICQGIEVLGKGYLLMSNYDHFKPKLRSYGHNLLKLVAAIESQAKVGILQPRVRAELSTLNTLYSQHLLRYGSGYDILVSAETIPSKHVLFRTYALLRLARRYGIAKEPSAI
jgi:hypothetical protein